jgi:transketolase
MQVHTDFRVALSDTFKQLASENNNLIFVTSDVGKSVNAANFKDLYGERYINVGIAEQDAVGVSAGFASIGFDVIFYDYAIFAAGRAWEIIRNYICYPNLNVKIIASHGGLNVGEDGATHQAIEDIAIMRALPNMTVLVVDDPSQVSAAIKAAFSIKGPVYVRTGRMNLGNSEHSAKWEIGKSEKLREGKDATIIAIGLMVRRSLEAAELLSKMGIECRVINMRCIKPPDKDVVLKAAEETGIIITVEEHNIVGGLFSTVCEITSQYCTNAVVIPIAVHDCFGESGEGIEVMEKYGLSAKSIIQAVISSQRANNEHN